MSVAWPDTLPQAPASFSDTRKPVTIRTQSDNGPAKVRRRFTKAVRKATLGFLLTIEQANILDAFYANDLNSGTVQMIFRHPWTGLDTPMWIVTEPAGQDSGPLAVQVTFNVEYF